MNEFFGLGLSIEAKETAYEIARAIVCESYSEMFNEGYAEAAKIMTWIEEESR